VPQRALHVFYAQAGAANNPIGNPAGAVDAGELAREIGIPYETLYISGMMKIGALRGVPAKNGMAVYMLGASPVGAPARVMDRINVQVVQRSRGADTAAGIARSGPTSSARA
jgi:hypothetical protein